jgi:hypothetical protein
MVNIQITSNTGFPVHAGLARQLGHLFSRSAAMGLLSVGEVTEFSPCSVRGLVVDLQQHGLARQAGITLAPLMQDGLQVWDAATERRLEHDLVQLAQALEDSPNPATEWPSMREALGDELLGSLLDVSASSLRRYAGGERATPEATAARLHWLAMVVSDLGGGYNTLGMRRWFERPRAQLEGRSPRAALGSAWTPDDGSAQRVRALAATLSGAQPLAV